MVRQPSLSERDSIGCNQTVHLCYANHSHRLDCSQVTSRDRRSQSCMLSHHVMHVDLPFGKFRGQKFNDRNKAPEGREKQRSLAPQVVPAVASGGLCY